MKAKKGVTATVVGGARQVASSYTSPNNECVAVQIKDSKKGSKAPAEYHYAQITIESCSPTVSGATSTALSAVAGQATTVFGNLVGQKTDGTLGNVVKTQSQKEGMDLKKGISFSGLTDEQQTQCNADLKRLSYDIKKTASQWVAEYEKANKGAKASATYTSTTDLVVLGLSGPTRGLSLDRK